MAPMAPSRLHEVHLEPAEDVAPIKSSGADGSNARKGEAKRIEILWTPAAWYFLSNKISILTTKIIQNLKSNLNQNT